MNGCAYNALQIEEDFRELGLAWLRGQCVLPTCEPDPGNAGGGILVFESARPPDEGGFFVLRLV